MKKITIEILLSRLVSSFIFFCLLPLPFAQSAVTVSNYGIKPVKPATVSVGGSATLYATLSFSQPATAVTGNLLVVDSKGKRYKQFPLSLGQCSCRN